MREGRDAFGRLLGDPGRLPFDARVAVARRLAGQLQASGDRAEAWLGQGLSTWLHEGGDLAAVLGLRPVPGSRMTAQEIVRAARCAGLLLALSTAAGSDRRAARILAGDEPAPKGCTALVAELQALDAPSSPAAFGRARVSRAA